MRTESEQKIYDRLESVKKYYDDVVTLKKLLKKVEERSEKTASPKYDGMPKSNRQSDITANEAIKMADLTKPIEDRIHAAEANLKTAKEDINSLLHLLNDGESDKMYSILCCRYILFMSIEDTAKELCMSISSEKLWTHKAISTLTNKIYPP